MMLQAPAQGTFPPVCSDREETKVLGSPSTVGKSLNSHQPVRQIKPEGQIQQKWIAWGEEEEEL